MFTTVLIANRGEIALRIARTCREIGIRTVVAHSSADKDGAAARFADETVQIGPAPARRSYLNAAAVLQAALNTGAEAIHPGYGFLAEDPDFAEMCEDAGLVFIGPPAPVLACLGDKARALGTVESAGLPTLPWSRGTVGSAAEARSIAAEIGYPVIIKAVAGGGGLGMGVVRTPHELPRVYTQVHQAATAVFGDGRVYLEKFVEAARHVEVQVLADRHGHVVHLGARDCSVQRRHQKLIEESPLPGTWTGMSERICEAAVRGARAAGYVGAGTFEFLLDENGVFSFIEANCRIQVEHPVTEMVTGLDLVREQLNVAAGHPLPLSQDEIVIRGAALECRVNAEDPTQGFRPCPGRVESAALPGGPFVRVDGYLDRGMNIPAEYDSLLAKIIVWAPDREQAIARMERALAEVAIDGPGVRTTAAFLQDVLAHPLFRDAKHSTALVESMIGAG
ncbi:acetyl/propionyl/methylcrotonyl-CoA carboxylase subunit alpha [Nonomuraea sp. NPDC059007]|uniref:acetyl-CoA carboxylase biotin carboxylase subunit n=1 Tax=Nonomuraea sp. NPDC059007 TaxID=3346692 RepID=UPI0036A153E5